jgi:beta-glucanase (GH16 family)
MKKSRVLKISLVALAIGSLAFAAPASALTHTTPTATKVVKKLLWKQEFNGSSKLWPNSRVFNYDLGGGGWGNMEHQAYIRTAAKTDGTAQGNLVFTARKYVYDPNDLYYQCPINTPNGACEYTSGRIQTSGKVHFQYGRLEARIRMPKGDGTWPAFWLLGNDIENNSWPNCGEIDIMEGKGAYPYVVWGSAHGPGYSGGDSITNTWDLSAQLNAGYHVYAIEWYKNKISWFIDNKLYHTITPTTLRGDKWVFNKPYFLILNLAMGGNFTGDIDPSITSTSMSVDYIRYYSLNGIGKVTGTSTGILAGKP